MNKEEFLAIIDKINKDADLLVIIGEPKISEFLQGVGMVKKRAMEEFDKKWPTGNDDGGYTKRGTVETVEFYDKNDKFLSKTIIGG